MSHKRKRSSSSSAMSSLARYASQASGASLGFIAGNVPGASLGWRAGGEAYDFTQGMDEDFAAYDAANVVPLPPTKMGKAMYAGRMKKPHSVQDSYMALATKIGGVACSEQFGRVQDPHCVYLTQSTYQLANMSFAMRFHLIRKLFYQSGIPINDRLEELPLYNTTNSDGFLLVYTDMNTLTGGMNTSQYTIVDNQTLTDVVNSFTAFTTAIESYFVNNSSREPNKLYLYQSDRNVLDTNWRLTSTINLMNEDFTLTSSSTIQLQNRTAGDLAAAGDLNTERADTQPLVGTVFQFRNADPRVRQTHSAIGGNVTNNLPLNGCALYGVRLARAGTVAVPYEFGPTIAYQNTPMPQIFANCMSTSKTILQPGSMKTCSIFYKVTGIGINFFKKLQLQHASGGTTVGCQIAGRSQIIVFEEKMRTIGTNNLTIHYEAKNTCCVTSKTRKGGSIVPSLTVSENNL